MMLPAMPYLFVVTTLTGTVTVNFPDTRWDVPAAPEVSGPGAAPLMDYIRDHGLGFHGHLFTLEAVSPMDLHHALLMNQTTHYDRRIVAFEAIGYVPDENPDPESAEEWDDDEDAEGEDD